MRPADARGRLKTQFLAEVLSAEPVRLAPTIQNGGDRCSYNAIAIGSRR